MDWFLCGNGLRHERVKVIDIIINITSKGCESNNIIEN